MATKRITDQTTDSALAAGDYVIIDSESEGSRKFDIGTEITELKEDLDNLQNEIYVSGTSLYINTTITDGNEVEY